MKKIFVMFATVAAFTLASCGGADKQKANEADTAPAVTEPVKQEEAKPVVDAKADSLAKSKQEAPKEGEMKKEGAEAKKEEVKPTTEVKKEEVKK